MAVMGVSTMTKESKLRNRNTRNQSVGATNGGTTCLDTNHKVEHRDYVSTESYISYILLNMKFLFDLQEIGLECTDEAGKIKHHDNPFIEPVQTQTVVDMKGISI